MKVRHYSGSDHDNLLLFCEETWRSFRDCFEEGKEVKEACVVWTQLPGRGEDYIPRILKLPKDKRRDYVLRTILSKKAYAVLLVELEQDHVRLSFESPSGAKEWTAPILKDRELGPTTRSTNRPLGLLWRPKIGVA